MGDLLGGMAVGKIKEEEAAHTWELYKELPIMVDSEVITQEEADELRPELNDKLHEALGLE